MTTKLVPGVLFSLLALAVPLAGQGASFTTYGTGCNVPGQLVPSFTGTVGPRIGLPWVVRYSGPNVVHPGFALWDQPVLALGWRRFDRPVPPLFSQQPSGCWLYTWEEVLLVMPVDASGTRFADRHVIAVPDNLGLLDAMVFMQWAVPHVECPVAQACDLRWVAFSGGAVATVGI